MQLAWGAKVSPAFRRKVVEVASRIGVDANALMACMAFESGGTFSPSVRNVAGSGATGLIQFMPITAYNLLRQYGIAVATPNEAAAKFASMTAEEQLDWVERYFRPYRGRMKTISDLYMAILWPAAVGQPGDYALFDRVKRAKTYQQNAGLDVNKDGIVTKDEAAAKVMDRLRMGLQAGMVAEITP